MDSTCDARAPCPKTRDAHSPRPTVILADDHEAILTQAAQLLKPHFEVVSMVRDGRAALEAVRQRTPDLLLLDMTMPVLDGIDTARELRKRGYQGKIGFLTVQNDPLFVQIALDLGACAYILKKSMVTELVPGVAKAIAGEKYLSPCLKVRQRAHRSESRLTF